MDDFLEFYNKTAKDGTWDKDDILLGVRESQDRHLYRVMHSSIELKKIIYAQEKACEVLGDEIIKLEVCNEEVIETIYEKNSEEN